SLIRIEVPDRPSAYYQVARPKALGLGITERASERPGEDREAMPSLAARGGRGRVGGPGFDPMSDLYERSSFLESSRRALQVAVRRSTNSGWLVQSPPGLAAEGGRTTATRPGRSGARGSDTACGGGTAAEAAPDAPPGGGRDVFAFVAVMRPLNLNAARRPVGPEWEVACKQAHKQSSSQLPAPSTSTSTLRGDVAQACIGVKCTEGGAVRGQGQERWPCCHLLSRSTEGPSDSLRKTVRPAVPAANSRGRRLESRTSRMRTRHGE
ncbi:hypothetical protein THAOC_12506, partial [Thalassiosira oceanica]